jgi:hypothetical protein
MLQLDSGLGPRIVPLGREVADPGLHTHSGCGAEIQLDIPGVRLILPLRSRNSLNLNACQAGYHFP